MTLLLLFLLAAEGFPSVGTTVTKTAHGQDKMGSCFVVDELHLLTAAHCVNHTDLTFKFDHTTLKADLVVLDTYRDWALFRLREPTQIPPLPIRTKDLPINAPCFALSLEREKISLQYGPGFFFGTLTPGSSGGPIFSHSGEVVAVATMVRKEYESCGIRHPAISWGHGVGELEPWVRKWKQSDKLYQVSR